MSAIVASKRADQGRLEPRVRWRRMVVLLALGGSGIPSHELAVTITATPEVITPGERVILEWNAPVGARVFVSGQDRATNERHGTIKVTPSTSTAYVAVSEVADAISFDVSLVRVAGTKGADFFRQVNDGTTSPVRIPAPLSFVDAVAVAEFQLSAQNFGIQRSLDGNTALVLETSFSERIVPPNDSDRALRARRVAYRVRVNRESVGHNTYEVWVVAEKKLKLESRWRLDESAAVRDAALELIRKLLAPGVN